MVPPDTLTDEFLDQKRLRGDPPADRVVAALIDTGVVDAVDREMVGLLRDGRMMSGELPAPLREYLVATGDPLEVDDETLRLGQSVFASYGPEVLVTLGFLSLPASYAARKGVQVLHRTAFLEQRPVRRVFETSRMLAIVMSPEGLSESGDAVAVMQRVRLMHAAIRHMLVHGDGGEDPWDTDDLGIPINQEDLAGTLMTFSYVVLAGLERLGLDIPSEVQEAYVRLWSAIGERMGVDDDLNPTTVAEAKHLTERIHERQIDPSPEGVAMAHALLEGYATWADRVPVGAPASMAHFFLDDDPIRHRDVASMLEIPKAGIFGILPLLLSDLVRATGFLFGRGPFQGRMGRWMSRHIVAGLLDSSSAAQGATFSIPDHVRDDWKLPRRSGRV